MKVVLSKPKIIEYVDYDRDEISIKWDNADGIACTGFMRLFSNCGIDFEWLQCINRNLTDDEIEYFSLETHQKLDKADFIVRVGSPAWFNETDIVIYKECIEHNIPFSLMSIGVGCKWDKNDWHVFGLKEQTLEDIAQSEQLKLISCRDPNCYSLFSGTIPNKIEINSCLGYLCLPSGFRNKKENVVIEVLDYDTLKNNGEYSQEDIDLYYFEMSKLVDFFDANSNLQLMIQRPFFEPILFDLHPQIVDTEKMSDVNQQVWEKYFPGRNPVFCSTYPAFESLFRDTDVLISGRVHGVLPAAGSGISCLGLGIDLRQFTWSMIPAIHRKDIRRMTPFSREVIDWWTKLNPEKISLNLNETRTRSERIYTDQMDFLLKSKNNKHNAPSVSEIRDEYHKELSFLKNKTISHELFEARLKYVVSSFDSATIVQYRLDNLTESEIATTISDLCEEYGYVFLLTNKDIKWWDEFLKTVKDIRTNAEIANSVRSAMGKIYNRLLSVFYCLEKK